MSNLLSARISRRTFCATAFSEEDGWEAMAEEAIEERNQTGIHVQ
jgi:hypothetical protein